MKQKIIIRDSVSGKEISKEINIRNFEHFEIQLKNRMNIFRDRKKYTRKIKHKNNSQF